MARGFYKRLVGTVKRSLRKSLGRTKVDDQQILTLLTEIKAIVNSRPLAYINDDINSLEPLTPAHFFSLNHLTGTPEIEDEYSPKETLSTALLVPGERDNLT